MKMFILRGKAGDYALPGGKSKYWANGALDDTAAMDFARLRGYEPKMIPVAGNSGYNSAQMREALKQIRADDDVFALYGFSAGGYTVWNIINKALTTKEKERLALVVVLGSPGPPAMDTYRGDWELIFRENPPEGHMAGPQALLKRPYGPD